MTTYRTAIQKPPQWHDVFSPIDMSHAAYVIAWAVRALCGAKASPPRFVLHRFDYGHGRVYELDGCDRIYCSAPSRKYWSWPDEAKP